MQRLAHRQRSVWLSAGEADLSRHHRTYVERDTMCAKEARISSTCLMLCARGNTELRSQSRFLTNPRRIGFSGWLLRGSGLSIRSWKVSCSLYQNRKRPKRDHRSGSSALWSLQTKKKERMKEREGREGKRGGEGKGGKGREGKKRRMGAVAGYENS